MFDYSIRKHSNYFAHWLAEEYTILSSVVGRIAIIDYSHDLARAQASHYA